MGQNQFYVFFILCGTCSIAQLLDSQGDDSPQNYAANFNYDMANMPFYQDIGTGFEQKVGGNNGGIGMMEMDQDQIPLANTIVQQEQRPPAKIVPVLEHHVPNNDEMGMGPFVYDDKQNNQQQVYEAYNNDIGNNNVAASNTGWDDPAQQGQIPHRISNNRQLTEDQRLNRRRKIKRYRSGNVPVTSEPPNVHLASIIKSMKQPEQMSQVTGSRNFEHHDQVQPQQHDQESQPVQQYQPRINNQQNIKNNWAQQQAIPKTHHKHKSFRQHQVPLNQYYGNTFNYAEPQHVGLSTQQGGHDYSQGKGPTPIQQTPYYRHQNQNHILPSQEPRPAANQRTHQYYTPSPKFQSRQISRHRQPQQVSSSQQFPSTSISTMQQQWGQPLHSVPNPNSNQASILPQFQAPEFMQPSMSTNVARFGHRNGRGNYDGNNYSTLRSRPTYAADARGDDVQEYYTSNGYTPTSGDGYEGEYEDEPPTVERRKKKKMSPKKEKSEKETEKEASEDIFPVRVYKKTKNAIVNTASAVFGAPKFIYTRYKKAYDNLGSSKKKDDRSSKGHSNKEMTVKNKSREPWSEDDQRDYGYAEEQWRQHAPAPHEDDDVGVSSGWSWGRRSRSKPSNSNGEQAVDPVEFYDRKSGQRIRNVPPPPTSNNFNYNRLRHRPDRLGRRYLPPPQRGERLLSLPSRNNYFWTRTR